MSFHDADATDLEGFCASIGRARDAERCRRLTSLFPRGRRVWYASPFPGREGNPVRDDGTTARLALFNSPTCFMMSWKGGEPLAAKAYPKLVGRLLR